VISNPRSLQNTNYVLVTPVRNEEKFIGRTIASVIQQTILPREWVIMSDGSTDKTNEIVKDAQIRHSWIKLFELPQRDKANWSAVVDNTTIGIASFQEKNYQFIGLLDADLEFSSDYFEKVILEFHQDAKLGLAGGVAIDIGLPKNVLPRNKQDVPGALQFFRRECLESIGGLIPIPEGGWDSVTCIMSRLKGFNTKLITHLVVDHLKPRNAIHGSILKRKWQMGIRDYALGYHPLFEFIKCGSRLLRERPPILAACAWFGGYLTATLFKRPRVIPPEIVRFTRSEQLKRLVTRN